MDSVPTCASGQITCAAGVTLIKRFPDCPVMWQNYVFPCRIIKMSIPTIFYIFQYELYIIILINPLKIRLYSLQLLLMMPFKSIKAFSFNRFKKYHSLKNGACLGTPLGPYTRSLFVKFINLSLKFSCNFIDTCSFKSSLVFCNDFFSST